MKCFIVVVVVVVRVKKKNLRSGIVPKKKHLPFLRLLIHLRLFVAILKNSFQFTFIHSFSSIHSFIHFWCKKKQINFFRSFIKDSIENIIGYMSI